MERNLTVIFKEQHDKKNLTLSNIQVMTKYLIPPAGLFYE